MNSGNVKYGIAGGLAGGLVFGAMMGMMGMLAMIGQMAGSSSAALGFAVHLLISAFIGGAFALLFGSRIDTKTAGLGYGLLYGAIWWILGPLTLMPVMMGMGVTWTVSSAIQALPSLMGHLIYGGILGWTFGQLKCRSCSVSTVEAR
jgi:uncharacterized membrane protein YagU involved in acid resistance